MFQVVHTLEIETIFTFWKVLREGPKWQVSHIKPPYMQATGQAHEQIVFHHDLNLYGSGVSHKHICFAITFVVFCNQDLPY